MADTMTTAVPADVRELARRLADENELSLFHEDLIVHAILAARNILRVGLDTLAEGALV